MSDQVAQWAKRWPGKLVTFVYIRSTHPYLLHWFVSGYEL